MIEAIFPRDGSDRFSQTDGQIHAFYKDAITQGIKTLLETKHLYQSVEVENATLLGDLEKAAIQFPPDPGTLMSSSGVELTAQNRQQVECQVRQKFLNVAKSLASVPWFFRSESKSALTKRLIPQSGGPSNNFDLPTIKTVCWKCKELSPHNSGYVGIRSDPEPYTWSMQSTGETVQVFSFTYQCQGCKAEPLVFTIRRENLKLTLVGRSHLHEPLTAKCIPKEIRKYCAQALVAKDCNYTLAALFYLRLAIEQWMRLKTKAQEKLTGEELGDLYANTLPPVVSGHFPSLKKIYESLSGALHAATEDDDLLARELQNVEKHFDGLRVHGG